MNDYVVIKEILSRAKVKFTENIDSEYEPYLEIASNGKDGPNRGYIGFWAELGFDKSGNLLYVGAWE